MGKTSRIRGSKGADRFFKAERYISETRAWKQVSPAAKATWLEFGWTYNGSNNGRLAMSSRQLAVKLNIGKSAAARAILELVTFGFLEITQAGCFSGTRRTAEYRLTQFNCDKTGELPSRAFQNIGKKPAGPGNGQADNASFTAVISPAGGTDRPATDPTQSR
jgi:hypothetical protein